MNWIRSWSCDKEYPVHTPSKWGCLGKRLLLPRNCTGAKYYARHFGTSLWRACTHRDRSVEVEAVFERFLSCKWHLYIQIDQIISQKFQSKDSWKQNPAPNWVISRILEWMFENYGGITATKGNFTEIHLLWLLVDENLAVRTVRGQVPLFKDEMRWNKLQNFL